MATIFVKSTQGADQILTDFPEGEYSPEEFNEALKENGVGTSGMKIAAQDLDELDTIFTVRNSEGYWEDSITVNASSTIMVSLDPKSTSNG